MKEEMNMDIEKFKELKKEILKRGVDNDACVEGYKMAVEAATMEELCQVIKEYFVWCCKNHVLDGSLIELYKEEFRKNKIYHNENAEYGCYLFVDGNNEVTVKGNALVFACERAKVCAYDMAMVEAYDESVVECSDGCDITAYNNTTVKAYLNCFVETWDDSTVHLYHDSIAESYKNSRVFAYDKSKVYAHDDSVVNAEYLSTVYAFNSCTVNARGNVYVVASSESAKYNLSECSIACLLVNDSIVYGEGIKGVKKFEVESVKEKEGEEYEI